MALARTLRLAAGDWVVVEGKDPTKRGVGKIVDGRYADEDDALESARVEFSNGTAWFATGDLSRVTPEEEAAVCERALDEGHVAGDRAARLLEDVTLFRAGKLSFVRSPGLLDRLWACLPEEPSRAPRTGLPRFFDECRSSVVAWRSGVRKKKPQALVAPPPATTGEEPPARRHPDADVALSRALEILSPASLERIALAASLTFGPGIDLRHVIFKNAPRVAFVLLLDAAELDAVCRVLAIGAESEASKRIRLVEMLTEPDGRSEAAAEVDAELACRRVLAVQSRAKLEEIARIASVPVMRDMSNEHLREEIRRCAPLTVIVNALETHHLALAAHAAGVPLVGDSRDLRAGVLGALTRDHEARTAEEADAITRRVLAVMSRFKLLQVARAAQVPVPTGMQKNQLRDALRLTAPRTAIVGVLDSSQLFHACRAAGLSADGDDEALSRRLLAAMTPPA